MIPELSASKVAGFIGLHKYQSSHEIAYELLCKDLVGKTRVAGLEKEYNLRPYSKLVNEVLHEWPIMDIVQSGIKSAQKTTNVQAVLKEVEAQAALVFDLRRDSFPSELKARLVGEVRGQVAKQRGLNNEEKILDTYETVKDVKVTERNTKTIKKDFGTFKLVGRCYGYVASENRFVDSKDRTRLWPEVPLYDEIQLRCYMNMYEAKESELIERFPDRTTRHTKYLNNPEKWGAIESEIRRGVEKLNAALHDEEELKRIVFANGVQIQSNGDKDLSYNSTRMG
jgi:hypothetical protein